MQPLNSVAKFGLSRRHTHFLLFLGLTALAACTSQGGADTPVVSEPTHTVPTETDIPTEVAIEPTSTQQPQPFEVVTPAGITIEVAKNPGIEINNPEALDILLYYIFSATDPLETPPGEITTEMIQEFREANPTIDMHVIKRMPGGESNEAQFPRIEGVRTDRVVINLFDPLQEDTPLPSRVVEFSKDSAVYGGYTASVKEDQDGNKTLHISIITHTLHYSQGYIDSLPEDRDSNRNYLAQRLNQKLAQFVLMLTSTGSPNLIEREIDGKTYFFVREKGSYILPRQEVFHGYFDNQPSLFSGIPN